MKLQIKYRDLSGWLKTVVVFGWIAAGFMLLSFIDGFLLGYNSY